MAHSASVTPQKGPRGLSTSFIYHTTRAPKTANPLADFTKKNEDKKSLPQVCSDLLRQAGPAGTGQVTFVPLFDENLGNSSELEEKRGHYLPTEAKAGIGVGLGIFLALLAVGGLLFCRRAKRRKKEQTSSALTREEFNKSELPDNAVPAGKCLPTEIDGNEKLELEASERVELGGLRGTEMEGIPLAEIDTHAELFELPAPSSERVELETSIKS
jgi:hypothetical protein